MLKSGKMMTKKLHNEIAQKEFFDDWVQKKDEDLKRLRAMPHSRFFELYYSPLKDSVVQLANKESVRLMLELGCGDGDYTLSAAETFKISIIGMDISKISVRWAKRKAMLRNLSGKAEFVVGDTKYLPFRSGAFDSVMIFGLVHHLSGFDVLQEVSKVMRKEGFLLVFEMVSNNPVIPIGARFLSLSPKSLRIRILDVGHSGEIPTTFSFRVDTLRNYIETRGFKIIKEEREQLFIFLIWYLFMLIPQVHRLVPVRILFALSKIEKYLLENTPMRELCRSFMSLSIRQ